MCGGAGGRRDAAHRGVPGPGPGARPALPRAARGAARGGRGARAGAVGRGRVHLAARARGVRAAHRPRRARQGNPRERHPARAAAGHQRRGPRLGAQPDRGRDPGLGPRWGPEARAANEAMTAATTLSVPPYRNHLPGVVAVMITLPLATGMDSTNAAMIQPIPGSSAPLTERRAQAASRQVSRMAAQQASAATGTGLGTRLYWKLPIMPCTTPAMNSTP